MAEAAWVIGIHQIVFQTMFVAKNIMLGKKTGKKIRGKNREATVSIVFFVLFIVAALGMSVAENPAGEVRVFSPSVAMVVGLGLLCVNLAVSAASLVHLKDSWRVGIPEDQKTELVTTGIYRFTRNPYFVSYLLMLFAYAVMLQNLLLFGLSAVGFYLIHQMVRKEEKHLYSVHGADYLAYRDKVPRYLLI